ARYHRRRKEAPGRPQRYHSRQNRIRMNTVAMPLRRPDNAAVQKILAAAGCQFCIAETLSGHGMDPRVFAPLRVASP
ncbi:hypothetical protein LB534_28825, partial [Mesorhizobium sp. CA18]|uniref:hypothetical protein n=1 Tax=unclassified Mesorhizobium TaxID=325217 RepID=UPI001CCDD88F